MEKNLIEALEKLEKMVNDKKIDSYGMNSSLFRGKKSILFDVVVNLEKKEVLNFLTAEEIKELIF